MPILRFRPLAGVGLLLATLLTGPAMAQDSRYSGSTWGPPDGDGTTPPGMIGELKALIDAAERARAADGRFISDLKSLVARYERTWTRRILFDDFSDGDLDRNPAWQVVSGEFWVEPRFGLRSLANGGSGGGETQKLTKKDLAAQLFGSVLNQALGGKQGSGSAQVTTAGSAAAVALLDGPITKAFAVTANISSWKGEGRLEIGVHQGGTGANGYRMVYAPGAQPRLELIKVTAQGRSVIETATGFAPLEDEKTHTLFWTRAADDTQTVRIDGQDRLRVRDVSFRDPFQGLVVVNAGGDFILRDIEVLGTPGP